MTVRRTRTTRHKVSKACWRSRPCRKRFIDQWEALGQFYLRTESIASNPTHLWAVFELL